MSTSVSIGSDVTLDYGSPVLPRIWKQVWKIAETKLWTWKFAQNAWKNTQKIANVKNKQKCAETQQNCVGGGENVQNCVQK